MNKIIEISVGMIYRRIGFDWMGPCRQEILFVLRNKKPFKEYFELPGGKLKENELPVDALKRELEERNITQSQIKQLQREQHELEEEMRTVSFESPNPQEILKQPDTNR